MKYLYINIEKSKHSLVGKFHIPIASNLTQTEHLKANQGKQAMEVFSETTQVIGSWVIAGSLESPLALTPKSGH